jgi:glycosyltransferase involved in cell wall biosynthesis
VLPGEEDFGMTMVESLASGKPVVAFARGGAVEIVREKCGVLYSDATEAGLAEALRAFDRIEPALNPLYLRTAVADFSEAVFEQEFGAAVSRVLGKESLAKRHTAEFTTFLQVPHDTRSARPL